MDVPKQIEEGEPMAKPKPTKLQVLVSLAPHAQTGRKPKKPPTANGRLDQLIKDSDAWIRKIQEVWFAQDDPIIEDAVGATTQPNLADKYDEAIATMRRIAAYAEVAEEKLQNGMQKAKKKLNDASK